MDAGISTDVCAVGDLDMTGKCGGVGHYDFAADLAIVCDMRLCHKKIVIANLRQTAAARRPAMDRHKFADMISFSYLGRRRFALIF